MSNKTYVVKAYYKIVVESKNENEALDKAFDVIADDFGNENAKGYFYEIMETI